MKIRETDRMTISVLKKPAGCSDPKLAGIVKEWVSDNTRDGWRIVDNNIVEDIYSQNPQKKFMDYETFFEKIILERFNADDDDYVNCWSSDVVFYIQDYLKKSS